MRLWSRYLREKKNTLFLLLLTEFLFLSVGSLYQIENLPKLFYAAVLVFAVWVIGGFLDGLKYVRKSRQLEMEFQHFCQSGELVTGSGAGDEPVRLPDSMEETDSYEEAQAYFLRTLWEAQDRERRKWEERTAECGDYYVMWTHQIKTPISAMKLLFERIDYGVRDGFLVREELFKIEQYVEMVLAFQRLESISSDLVLQQYDLYHLLKQAVKKYSVLFINKGLKLELEEMEFKIVTDEKWFIFALEQLLSNSIKYTPEGKIAIWTKRQEGQILLFLEDTGIGIHAEDLPRIFEKGFTGYNGRMDRKATGIGLYLCRRILNYLGIHVKAESEEGKGTRMVLEIPWEEKNEKASG